MTDESVPAKRPCGACCGRGVSCSSCYGTGEIEQQRWQCKHFVSEWADCEQCIEEETITPLRLERDRYRTALETIAESCNTIESATEVACEALGGKQ